MSLGRLVAVGPEVGLEPHGKVPAPEPFGGVDLLGAVGVPRPRFVVLGPEVRVGVLVHQPEGVPLGVQARVRHVVAVGVVRLVFLEIAVGGRIHHHLREVQVHPQGAPVAEGVRGVQGDVDRHLRGVEIVRDVHGVVEVDVAAEAGAPLALVKLGPVQLRLHLLLGGNLGEVPAELVEVHAGERGRAVRVGGPVRELDRGLEGHPEEVEPPPPDGAGDVVALDVRRHLLPGAPGLVLERPVEILLGLPVVPGDDVQGLQGVGLGLGVQGPALVEVQGDDVQPGPGLQPLQVAHEGVLRQVLGDLTLQKRALQVLEKVALVQPKLGFHPVLGEEEDLPVRLPDPVALHPLPPVRVDGQGRDVPFRVLGVAVLQVHQDPLDEGLDRRQGQPQAGGLHHRFHARVHQEILEEVHGRGGAEVLDILERQEVGAKGVALLPAQGVEDRLGDRAPGVPVVLGLDGVLEGRGHRVARGAHRGEGRGDGGGGRQGGGRQARGLDDLERVPKGLDALLVREIPQGRHLAQGRPVHRHRLFADEAQGLGRVPDHLRVPAGQVRQAFPGRVRVEGGGLPRRVLGERLAHIDEDVDQPVAGPGGALPQRRVLRQGEELGEELLGLGPAVVRSERGEGAELQARELVRVGGQVVDLPLVQRRALDQLERLGQKRPRPEKGLHGGEGIQPYLGQGSLREVFPLHVEDRPARPEVVQVQAVGVGDAPLQPDELARLVVHPGRREVQER